MIVDNQIDADFLVKTKIKKKNLIIILCIYTNSLIKFKF